MTQVTRTATFSPADSPERILEDLSCPLCGARSHGDPHRRITDNTLRMFCDGCGAFVSIRVTDAQADALSTRFADLSRAEPRR